MPLEEPVTGHFIGVISMDDSTSNGAAFGDGRKAFDHDGASASVIDLAIRLVLLGVLVYLTIIIVRPLSGMIIWSVVLAVALYPIFRRLTTVFGGRRRLAAFSVTIAAILVVLGPMTVPTPAVPNCRVGRAADALMNPGRT